MSSEPTRDHEPAGDPYAPPSADTRAEAGDDDPSTLREGVLAGVVILVFAFGMILLGPLAGLGLFGGVTQWLVVVPVVISWRRAGRRAAARGLLIVAGIGFLLNATCTGLVMMTFSLH